MDSTRLYKGIDEPAANQWTPEVIDLEQFFDVTREVQVRITAHPFTRALVDDFQILGLENSLPTAVEPEMPQELALHENYPNPFAHQTTLRFSLPTASGVSLRIFNALGQQQMVLLENQHLPAGEHTIPIQGQNLPSGMYLVTLQAGNQQRTTQMVRVR